MGHGPMPCRKDSSQIKKENRYFHEDRTKLIAVFGGDCIRVTRLRKYVEMTELSDLHAKDKRKDMCEAACDSIENVLIDKVVAFQLLCS